MHLIRDTLLALGDRWRKSAIRTGRTRRWANWCYQLAHVLDDR